MPLDPSLRKLVSGAANKYSRSSGSRIKPKEGVNRYRILVPSRKDAPWMPANGQFWADLGVHWIKAEENGKPLAVIGCRSIVYQEPSEIAPAIDRAIASAIDEESKKLYEGWKARPSILVNVLDRSKGSSDPDTPQILELTPTTWGAVMGVIQQFDEEGEDVLDANEGLDITITRTGKGLNTQYAVNTAPGKSAPVPKGALQNCHDLMKHIEQEFFREEPAKALAQIATISGVSLPRLASSRTPTSALTSRAASVEEVDEEPKPAPRKAVKPAPVEEEDEAPFEEEPKPAARKAVKAPPVEIDEDDVSEADLDDVLADLEDL